MGSGFSWDRAVMDQLLKLSCSLISAGVDTWSDDFVKVKFSLSMDALRSSFMPIILF